MHMHPLTVSWRFPRIYAELNQGEALRSGPGWTAIWNIFLGSMRLLWSGPTKRKSETEIFGIMKPKREYEFSRVGIQWYLLRRRAILVLAVVLALLHLVHPF